MPKLLSEMSPDQIKEAVKAKYTEVASQPRGAFNFPVGRRFAEELGYPATLLNSLPSSVWESFTGVAYLHPFTQVKPGQRLLDLGCGAGLDLTIYAQAVGPTGKVDGLDLSSEMVAKARQNALTLGLSNVEVHLGDAESLPFPEATFDLVASNGIYNLSPRKEPVLREVFRVLKRGARLVAAEVVLSHSLPEEARQNLSDWFRCIGGACVEDDFVGLMKKVGLVDIEILFKGRNARTGHPFSLAAILRAQKPAK